MPKFTVVGLCEEQRHAFHVTARNAEAAEAKCKRDHDSETSFTLIVAGVLRGWRKMLDGGCRGLDVQQQRS